jgi:hypothetical protein
MDVFRYEPLDSDRPIFRLLRLHKGSGLVIECELFEASFASDDLIPYEALSYTWGGTEFSASVQLAQYTFAVTENLYLAMQYIRSREEDRILWVDAICIDQGNPKERGHQVGQMGTIYTRADRVIFWLGPPTDETDILMDSLKRLEERSTQLPCSRWSLIDKRWPEIWSSLQLDLMSQHWDLAARQTTGLKTLLARPWFRRVWILQEVANPKRALVSCGTKSVSTRSFALAPVLLNTIPEPHCQAVLDIMPGPSRKDSWWNQKRDLYTLLQKFRYSKAGDQRDMIFALLGISSDAHDTDYLRADYEKSVEQVIHATITFVFGHPHHPCHTMSQFLSQFTLLNEASLVRLTKFSDVNRVAKYIKERQSGTSVTSAVVEAAAGNEEYGGEVTKFLFKLPITPPEVTKDAVLAAARNAGSGGQVMRCLFDQSTAQFNIIETAIAAAAENIESGAEVIKLFLHRDRNATLEAAASCGEKLMEFILHQEGVGARITKKTILNAASNEESGPAVMSLLLQQRGFPVRIRDAVLMQIRRNRKSGNEVMKLLLEQRIDRLKIDQELINTVVCTCRPAVVELFVEKQGTHVHISEDLVTWAAQNPWAEQVMEILIQERAKSTDITLGLVIELEKRFPPRHMELLFAQRGDHVNITEDMLKRACGKIKHAETIALLLKHGGDETQITEEVVKAAAKNFYCGGRIVNLLYEQRKSEVKITEDIIQAAAANRVEGLEVMKLLLEQCEERLEITNETLIVAARNRGCARSLLDVLLQYAGPAVMFTEEVIEAALMNGSARFDVVEFLLTKHAERFVVTEWLTVELAQASKPTRMGLLLKYRGNDVWVTEKTMEVASNNTSCGDELREMLLKHRGDRRSELERKLTQDDTIFEFS